MKKLLSFLMLGVALLLTSCGSDCLDEQYEKVQYLPFQTEEDGGWGLISTDGKVLFEDEFKNRPTMVANDRFAVKNSDGEWEIYTAEEKPKQVGDDSYTQLGMFWENVTPAVKKGKAICLINIDGEVVKELDKLGGKTVKGIYNFHEGLAIFQTEEDLYGAIDTDGEVVIEPKYAKLNTCNDGKLIAIEKKFKDEVSNYDYDKIDRVVLNKNGENILTLKGSKFTYTGNGFYDGKLIVSKKKGDETEVGIIDEEGEWVFQPKKKVKGIGEIYNNKFTFYDGDKWGLMNTDGEILIRAKYDQLFFVSKDILAAKDDNKERDERCRLMDLKGENIGNERFSEIDCAFFGSGYFLAETDKEIQFVDKDGEILDLENVSPYRIKTNGGDSYITSEAENAKDELPVTDYEDNDYYDEYDYSSDSVAVESEYYEAPAVEAPAYDYYY